MKKFFLILSALIMIVSVVSCKKEEYSVSEPDTDYTIITMDDLKAINGDNLEIEYDFGRIETIDGEIAYFPVTDKDKAYEAFMGIAELLGIENTEDFVYNETASHENPNGLNDYYFQQYYKGIKIYGAYVQIIVNPQHTEWTSTYSSYIPNLDIDTEPKISEEEAIKRAESKYNTTVSGNPELVISDRVLAWDMDLSGSDTYRIIMRADNGTILYEEETIID
ncbi:MAG: hypothetical protein K2J40_03135 [Ruminococcus sp.]|nr:hypothetical protein [Ruminococcus sp.]